jgi:DNA-binding transcriptional LysR family regulator
LDEVDEGRLDLVFTQPENVRVGMTSRMLACEELVLVCASTNAFASGASPTLDSLEGKTFIDLKADWGMRRLIDRSFSAKGLSRNSAFEVNDISMLLELVARDLGIALVPKSVAQSRLHDTASNAIAVIELVDDEAPCWELIVAYKGRDGKPGNKVTKTFLSLLVSNTGDSVQYEAEG